MSWKPFEQFDGERERLRSDRERDAIRFDEWRNGMETEKNRLEERLRDCDGVADTRSELPTTESEGGEHEEHEQEGHTDSGSPIEIVEPSEEGTSGDAGTEGPPPISTVPGVHGEGGDLMHSVSRLLEAQTQMMAAQANAMAAQSFPPMPRFTAENIQSDDDNFDRWIEQFEERAKLAGWTEEQRVYQLKAHLEKTALQAFRMLPEGDKGSYTTAVEALKKQFHPVDIEELRSLEFHQLMQEQQSVEQLGIELQSLARRAFPEASQEFDRLVKGRFFQALLPKWQRKLGAPRATESFSDLYDRARTLERHDKQFSASATARGDGKSKGTKPTPSNRPLNKQDTPRRPDGPGGRLPTRDSNKNPSFPDRESSRVSTRVGGRGCFRCGSLSLLVPPISRAFLHQIGKRLRRLGHSLPMVRLYGKGGKENGKELTISAQTSLTFAADGKIATVPVFIQPDSEVLCLLGMNVLPALGVTFLRANGEFLQTSESLSHDPTTAQVCLIQTSYVPTQKATFLEAIPNRPLRDCEDLS